MGFDISIDCALHVCDKTGKLFYYGKDAKGNFTRIYGIPNVEVPEEYRDLMIQRGRIFHVYTDEFNERNVYNVDIYEFLESFPTWQTVFEWMKDNDWTLEDWNEEIHKKFKEALEWCTSTGLPFRISWSY